MPQISRKPKYGTAESRWAGIGPYYAMFPTSFADEVIRKYTQSGDAILDPFSGRGTAVYSAAIQNRPAIGIEINPLGYVYANAKLKPGSKRSVLRKLEELMELAPRYRREASELPQFFHLCFSDRVREFLMAARSHLDWNRRKADRTLMALILVSMHGKRPSSLSNQMRQTTAMAPDYCVRWWTEKNMPPPDINPAELIAKRVQWRYAKGLPQTGNASVLLGDSLKKLPGIAREINKSKRPKIKLLLTSPPYHNVTNYYYDQWLRFWLLGGPDHPRQDSNRYGGKFSSSDRYCKLLRQIFSKARQTLANDAIVYVRTDQRETTLAATRTILSEVFPEKQAAEKLRPLAPERRTKSYSRGGAPKRDNCEIDIVLKPR